MAREEIIRYIEDYASSFHPRSSKASQQPGFAVTARACLYLVGTSRGELIADQVVLATGPYQVPLIPRLADRLPDELSQLHSAGYRSPEQLPPGRRSIPTPPPGPPSPS